MSLSNDLSELVLGLPDDWLQALVSVRYETTLQPFRAGFPEDNPPPAAQLIRPVLGANTPLHVTRGYEEGMVAAMRAVEAAGYQGQVSLREVRVAGTEKIQSWSRPEEMNYVRPEEVPGGGFVLRAA